MRNDESNPSGIPSAYLVSMGSMCAFLFSSASFYLIADSASVSIWENWVFIACTAIFAASVLYPLCSKILSWGWKAEHFGLAAILPMLSVILFFSGPYMTIASYSPAPIYARIALGFLFITTHLWWSARVVLTYKKIINNESKLGSIYQEEDNTLQFRTKVEARILEKDYQLAFTPNGFWLVGAVVAAFSLFFFSKEISTYFGANVVLMFVSVCGFPISMMATAYAVRAAIAYYYIPMLLRQKTGKFAYVNKSAE